MRWFQFTLRLPDGEDTTVEVRSASGRWQEAYAEACRTAEADNALPSGCGIICLDYLAGWQLPAGVAA